MSTNLPSSQMKINGSVKTSSSEKNEEYHKSNSHIILNHKAVNHSPRHNDIQSNMNNSGPEEMENLSSTLKEEVENEASSSILIFISV